MICMFDEDCFNNLRQVPNDNPWPINPTNQNYKIPLLKQSYYWVEIYFLEFKYVLDNAINKKWPKNHTNLVEDSYESLTLVYCKEVDTH